jgi:type II secretory pathway pseudopilin PulG
MNFAEVHTEKQRRQRSCRPHNARPSLRRGASLVEVLVVIVIILIGVFSVIRIFPIGFAGMSRAAQRTFAQRLASQQVEQLGSDVTLLPRGVLGPVTFNSQGVKVIDTTLDPDDLGPLNVSGPYPYFSDVNKFRRIEGEAVRVPSPSESGSIYALKFGPMYMEPSVAANSNDPTTSQFLNVYGAPMRGIPIEAETSNPFAVRGYLRTRPPI